VRPVTAGAAAGFDGGGAITVPCCGTASTVSVRTGARLPGTGGGDVVGALALGAAAGIGVAGALGAAAGLGAAGGLGAAAGLGGAGLLGLGVRGGCVTAELVLLRVGAVPGTSVLPGGGAPPNGAGAG